MDKRQELIEQAFENRAQLSPHTADKLLLETVNNTLQRLSNGELRVAEKIDSQWHVHQWLKKAVLLSFRLFDNQLINTETSQYFDKVPAKYQHYSLDDFKQSKVRVVPASYVRHASFIGENTIIMPSFINIGAYVDSGCMIDTWASVGSCAQIGKNVHLSGGAGIGGVLEPLQANPTIIEDNCFIGARSEIVEGVIVEKNSVISMGVFIGQSTKIYHREKDEIIYGRVPEGSVVVPGTLPGHNNKYQLQCAVIVKQVDQKTREKTSINELLRGDL